MKPQDNTQNHHPNIDCAEIEKFNQYANSWWDEAGEFKTLHQINPLRLDYIKTKTDAFLQSQHHEVNSLADKTILDVGCGGGILSESLSACGAHVHGIDLADDALNVAKLHLHESQLEIQYTLTSVEDHAQQHQQHYDVITCLEMLEHVPHPESVIQACSELVKPGGLIFFSTLNRSPKSYLMAIIGAEYVLNILPKGTHDYQKFIKPSELDTWSRQHGLFIRHITGIHYNPLSKHFWLAPGLDVNYIACLQKPLTQR